MEIDLTVMPQGKTYEDQYRGYLDIFARIANASPTERAHVTAPPWSWVPLLRHLDCDMTTPQAFFASCLTVRGALLADPSRPFDRTILEVLCNFRPETADALWKCDMQWITRRAIKYAPVAEFIVTTNGAFHRPEVIDFIRRMRLYVPDKRNVVLVPCAADKPYPAPMHKAVLDMLPPDFYLMNVTGVLGLIPQAMWSSMPHYDSGIPNRWRVFEEIKRYFTKWQHDRVVVFCDFYSEAVQEALNAVGYYDRTEYAIPVQFYSDYLDLMQPEHLDALRRIIQGGRAAR